jgi:hypothetical protein
MISRAKFEAMVGRGRIHPANERDPRRQDEVDNMISNKIWSAFGEYGYEMKTQVAQIKRPYTKEW